MCVKMKVVRTPVSTQLTSISVFYFTPSVPNYLPFLVSCSFFYKKIYTKFKDLNWCNFFKKIVLINASFFACKMHISQEGQAIWNEGSNFFETGWHVPHTTSIHLRRPTLPYRLDNQITPFHLHSQVNEPNGHLQNLIFHYLPIYISINSLIA